MDFTDMQKGMFMSLHKMHMATDGLLDRATTKAGNLMVTLLLLCLFCFAVVATLLGGILPGVAAWCLFLMMLAVNAVFEIRKSTAETADATARMAHAMERMAASQHEARLDAIEAQKRFR
jgi:hypothetical protein